MFKEISSFLDELYKEKYEFEISNKNGMRVKFKVPRHYRYSEHEYEIIFFDYDGEQGKFPAIRQISFITEKKSIEQMYKIKYAHREYEPRIAIWTNIYDFNKAEFECYISKDYDECEKDNIDYFDDNEPLIEKDNILIEEWEELQKLLRKHFKDNQFKLFR